MAFDKYVKLPGSERQPMPGAAKTGVLDPNQPMHVTVVLRERPAPANQPSLAELVASGGRVSRDEYAAQYGADPRNWRCINMRAGPTVGAAAPSTFPPS